ncbi:MAG: efflux RND transporter periplasmic adaptor subunit [Flavobacteriales bacterium]|nr:efflux RND transporter periplasmic adaptor subunit [Flavobacteriales bacterium]
MNKVFILFACITTLFVGCKSDKQEQKNAHVHAHIDPLTYTIYSDQSELFVEFKPLIVGETSKFATHFTKLGENFTAIEEGSVSLKLIGEKDQPSFKSEAPFSPGIFRLKLKPINTGKYKLVFYINTKTYSDTITIENVTVYPNEKLANDNPQENNIGEEIIYLKEQAWKVPFANYKVVKQPFAEIIKTTGHILAAQGDEVIITANSTGIITFGNSNKQIGSAVSSGETLFSIGGGGLTENNINIEFATTKAEYEKSKAAYERAQKLMPEQVISTKEFQEIELDYKNAKTHFNTISKNYSENGKKITSPLTGFIKNLLVTEGQYVEIGQAIASVSQNKRLMLRAEVPQKHYTKLGNIASANFITAYDNKVYNTDSLNGQFISYGKSTDQHAFYIPVNFEIDNKGDIIPGSYIEIFLKTTAINNVLTIPLSSLMEEQGHYYAFVQSSGEGFQKRVLELGISDGKNVQVISGIKENERVVSKGAYQIKLATMSGKMPAHGHEH